MPPPRPASTATDWAWTEASYFDPGGGGGACGNLQDGRFHFAELGTASLSGTATGIGWIARLFGYNGELPCDTELWITYNGRTTYASKGDRGYGTGGNGTYSWSGRAIDLTPQVKNYLRFPDGTGRVGLALNTAWLARGPNNTLRRIGFGSGQGEGAPVPTTLGRPSGSGDLSDWSSLVHESGRHAGDRGSSLDYSSQVIRKTLAKGSRFSTPKGAPYVTSYVDLKLKPIKVTVPHAPTVTVPGSGGGSVKPAGGWLPAGALYIRQREDQGQDFETRLGTPIIAPGNGYCVHHLHDGPFPNGFGSPYAVVHIDDGPWAGNDYYIGHVNDVRIGEGDRFRCGQTLGVTDNSLNAGLGWVELGLAPGGYPTRWGGSSSIVPLFRDMRTC